MHNNELYMYIILRACLMNVSALSKKHAVVALPTRRCCHIVSFYVNSAFLCHSATELHSQSLRVFPFLLSTVFSTAPLLEDCRITAGHLQRLPLSCHLIQTHWPSTALMFSVGSGGKAFSILKKKPRDS